MKHKVKQQVDDLLLFSDSAAFKLLQQVAEKHGIPPIVLEELLAWERAQQERKNAYGRAEFFDQVLENREYWENKS